MTRYSPAQISFAGGITTPRIEARDDLVVYPRSLRAGENFIVLPHGALTHRPGTLHVTPIVTETARAALIPFEFSTEQAYVTEFGEQTAQFFTNQGLLTTGPSAGSPLTIARQSLQSIAQGGLVSGGGDGPASSITLSNYLPFPDVPQNRTIVVMITGEDSVPGTGGATVTGVSYGTQNFTQAVRAASTVALTQNFSEIWYLHAPDDGPFNITVTFSKAIIARGLTAVTLLNVDPDIVPTTATATGTTAQAISQSITPANDKSYISSVVSYGVHGNGVTTGTGHAQLAELDPGDNSMLHMAGEQVDVDTSPRTLGYLIDVVQNRSALCLASFSPELSEGGSGGVSLVTPYSEDQVGDIQYAQLNDVMYLTHFSHWPRVLTRLTPTSFGIAKVEFQGARAPFLRENLTATTIALTGTTLIASDTLFDSTKDTGRFIRRINSSTGAQIDPVLRIVTVTTDTEVEVEVAPGSAGSLGNFSATTDYQLGAFSDLVGPNSVIFHEGRLAYGGGYDEDRAFLSVSDGFDDFDQGEFLGSNAVDDDRAFSRRCISQGVNSIRWFASATNELFIGTTGGEFHLHPANEDFLTPTSASIKPLSTRGATNVQAFPIDGNVMFVQRGGQKVRNLKFSLSADNYKPSDVTVMSEHLFNRTKTAKRFSYQQTPESILWVCRQDGALMGLTFEEEQEVLAWHEHILGGTDAVVESIATIPTPDTTEDQLWMIVRRTVTGATRRYVEYMDIQYRPDVDFRSSDAERIAALTEGHFMDSGLRADFGLSPVNSVSGLDHLEGETVQVTVNGGVHPDRVVVDGEIELTGGPWRFVNVGLFRKAFGYTQRITGGGRLGTDQGQKHRINRLGFRLMATVGLVIGSGPDAEDHARDVYFRKGDDLMNNPPPLFYGDIDEPTSSGWTREPTVYFEQPLQMPCTILGIYPRAETNER